MAQQAKDPALSRLWRTFDFWPRNFCMPWVQKKKKKKKAIFHFYKGGLKMFWILGCTDMVLLQRECAVRNHRALDLKF